MQQELLKAGAVKRMSLATAMTLLILGGFVAITVASPPSGVKPTPLVRGTYHDFTVKTDPESPIDFQAKSKSPVDVFVRQHDYEPGGSTGWHSHPGPVFITVNKGTLTYYLRNDPECKPHVVRTGEGFVDDGHGHIVFNETDEPAQDISVILAPVGGVSARSSTPPTLIAGSEPSCGSVLAATPVCTRAGTQCPRGACLRLRETGHRGGGGRFLLSVRRERARYRKRAQTVEPLFGNTKHNNGVYRFHRRGRDKVRTEWRLLMMTHNLGKLHRHQLAAAAV